MDEEPKEARLRPDAPQVGPVTVENIRVALAYLEPDDPALQAMIDGAAPLHLALLERVVENTLSFWRVVLKDRRLGLWAALVHFFDTVEREEERKDQNKGREKKLATLGGLMLRILEAEWTRLHPAQGRRDADLAQRESALLRLMSALLDHLVQLPLASRPNMQETFFWRVVSELQHRENDPNRSLLPVLKLINSVLHFDAAIVTDASKEHGELLLDVMLSTLQDEAATTAISSMRKLLAALISLTPSNSNNDLSSVLMTLLTGVLDIAKRDNALQDRSARIVFAIISAVKTLENPKLLSLVVDLTTMCLSQSSSLLRPLRRRRIEALVALDHEEAFLTMLRQLKNRPVRPKQNASSRVACPSPTGHLRRLLSCFKPSQPTLPSFNKALHRVKTRKRFEPSKTPLPLPTERLSLDVETATAEATGFAPSQLPAPPLPSTERTIREPLPPFPPYSFGASIATFVAPASLNLPRLALSDLSMLPQASWFRDCSTLVRRMSCHDSSQELVVKYGTVTGPLLEEADCLRLLGATTQLLLPQVVAFDQDLTTEEGLQNQLYMTLLPGERLGLALPSLDDQARLNFRRTFADALKQLSSLRPTPGFTGDFADPFYTSLELPAGLDLRSFPDLSRPLNHRRLASWISAVPRLPMPVQDEAEQPAPPLPFDPSAPLTFTHGDLVGRNILVNPVSGCLTGLLDWERAGWWPVGVERAITLHGAVVEAAVHDSPSLSGALLVDSLPQRARCV